MIGDASADAGARVSQWLALLTSDLAGLTGLAANDFVLVPNALAEIRLGWANGANLRSDLADHLLVVTGYHDSSRRGQRVRAAIAFGGGVRGHAQNVLPSG